MEKNYTNIIELYLEKFELLPTSAQNGIGNFILMIQHIDC